MINTSVPSYHGDGLRMIGYFAIDDANPGPRPAVLVAPEAPGGRSKIASRVSDFPGAAVCLPASGSSGCMSSVRFTQPKGSL